MTSYQQHTDNVADKLELLGAAWRRGDHDLAMSLADSIHENLRADRDLQPRPATPVVGADAFGLVRQLPEAWQQWALGWRFYKTLALFETVGIERAGEPVDLPVALLAEQVSDVHRELRVARIGPDGTLAEVPSQVYGLQRTGSRLHCRVVFPARVPAHGRTTYLLFYGNRWAELPDYPTDLRVRGQGYGLEIENDHFVAALSQQMGQLERIRLKRQHGLELYAGGKGHGEPPTIDWGHDYVDPGHFQKLRMRNWPRCPNWEVVRGPLCVRVRRWGFPYSPLHPVFTPSRMHMDVTYVFHAGLPYFFKEGRMDMVKDHDIEAMRDDEWVFSGYSFTQTVWLDAQGRLHEGPVPAEAADNLWGVGFYHDRSRDAFIALRLEHAAQRFDGLKHGGVPTLHYPGHGQLWSRYPAGPASFRKGASIRQKNAYLVLPYEARGGARRVERLRHQLTNPLEARAVELEAAAPRPSGHLARQGETEATAGLKAAVWRALRQVRDEQLYKIDANIVDMGYVYDVRVRGGCVSVLVTMPHRGRPVYDFLVTQGGGRVEEGIRERVTKIAGVTRVVVEFTWDPPWSVARLSDTARRLLGLAT